MWRFGGTSGADQGTSRGLDPRLAARQLSGGQAGCSRTINTHFGSHIRRNGGKRSRKKAIHRRMELGVQAAYSSCGAFADRSEVKVWQQDREERAARRVVAETTVHATVDEVWQVLTDYDRLANFVPNLEACERILEAPPGRVRLRQRASSQTLYWRLQAEALLELQEIRKPMGRRELHFVMLEGDFEEFTGQWVVEPNPAVTEAKMATVLRYEIYIVPKWSIPSTIVTSVVKAGLPANIRAIADRAEQVARTRSEAPGFIARNLSDDEVTQLPFTVDEASPPAAQEEVLPAKGPSRLRRPTVRLKAGALRAPWRWREARPSRTSTWASPQCPSRPSSRTAGKAPASSSASRQKEKLQASYPAFDVGGQRGVRRLRRR
eukprot:jgi/Botrbrau1/64/Bobra.0022s0057.1